MKHPFLSLADANEPFTEELIEAASRVIRSGRYIGGPEVEELEHAIAKMTGSRFCVGVSNGFDALRLILVSLVLMGKLEPHAEILYPANTCIATALSILHAGLTPVAVDVDPRTMLITAETVKRAMTARTAGIVPVHLYGRVCNDPDLKQLAKERNWIVVEDAAQAMGAKGIAKFGKATAISFYPTKNLGALGDGGAVVTNTKEIADKVRSLANYGATDTSIYGLPGYNCRLDPIQAAMLMVKIPHLKAENRRRAKIAATYSANINNPAIIVPPMPENLDEMVWHQYVITITDGDRMEFEYYLRKHGVETAIHYRFPVHFQNYFRESATTTLQTAERLSFRILSLPIGAPTTVDDAKDIANIINQWVPENPSVVDAIFPALP